MISLRRLNYFVTVVDLGSFTRAAEQLAVSQPGLSHQIKALEAELGGRLLDRTGRTVSLTVLGRAVLPHARAALEHGRRATEAAEAVRHGTGGSINVSTINSLSLAALPKVLAVWRATHPEVEIHLHEHADVELLLDAFALGEADLAVTPLPENWTGPRRWVGSEELVVAVPEQHHLARRERVDMAQLSDERWVHFTGGHGLGGVLDHLATLHGFRPRVAMRTGQTAAAAQYVAAGMGLAILPANLVGEGCVAVHLDPPVAREVYVITGPDPEPLTAALADTVADCIPLASPS